MHVEWYGQSAFRLQTNGTTVFIDPFGDMAAAKERGLRWDYPAIEHVDADLLLVTHEHGDHNGVETIGGDPVVIRSTAGTHDTPIGEVIGVASEHDQVAGTQRGPNTIYVFELEALRVAHFGDFGQRALRPEQVEAIGQVNLAFLPVGGGPTMGGELASTVARQIGARWVVPHHYRSARIDFLEPVDDFLGHAAAVHSLDDPSFDTQHLPRSGGPIAVVPAAP
jgi:L-ascorbate metabolism protein UlaG (beta-lactamase superfamily)